MKPTASLILNILFLIAVVAPTVNGDAEHEPILINSDADFAAAGFRGAGTKIDPYIIDWFTINSLGNMSSGIEVKNTNAHFLITNCEIHADYMGINIHNIAPATATIRGNTITGSRGEGGGIVVSADGVIVQNNTCINFTDGIHTNYADDCVIEDNNFSNNTYHGISLRYSSRNLIINNTVIGNKAHGVFIIRTSQNNKIYNNTVLNNSVLKSYDWDNLYHFTVTSQAADEGTGNTWYNGEQNRGNYWSDYNGVGAYKIDGSANAADNYPIKVEEPGTETDQSGQVGIPGFPFEASILGLALGTLYMLVRKTAPRAPG